MFTSVLAAIEDARNLIVDNMVLDTTDPDFYLEVKSWIRTSTGRVDAASDLSQPWNGLPRPEPDPAQFNDYLDAATDAFIASYDSGDYRDAIRRSLTLQFHYRSPDFVTLMSLHAKNFLPWPHMDRDEAYKVSSRLFMQSSLRHIAEDVPNTFRPSVLVYPATYSMQQSIIEDCMAQNRTPTYEERIKYALARAVDAGPCNHLQSGRFKPRRVDDALAFLRDLEVVLKNSRRVRGWLSELNTALANEKASTAQLLGPPSSTTSSVLRLSEAVAASQRDKDAVGARAAFDAFPILGRRALQARSSRTWGVELEVVDAGNVHAVDFQAPQHKGKLLVQKSLDVPQGWAAVRDGSLRNMVGDGKFYDPWEFVSPVFTRTFDPGLQHLCDQIKSTVAYARAGVHVHVGAVDRDGVPLQTMHINRLFTLYYANAPLFVPILERKTDEFCKPFDFAEWAEGWYPRGTPRKPRRPLSPRDPRFARRRAPLLPDAVAQAKARVARYKSQPDDNTHRYRDVNVESLVKHGTIEFRGLGAVYDYEHIVKWAWMCREMVNLAASNIPLAPFVNAPTLDAFMFLLRDHARESLGVAKRDTQPVGWAS